MRNGKLLLIASITGLSILASCREEATEDTSIKKEVRMEDENGVKTLTITTTENGVKSEEIYTGEEAERMMLEMEDELGDEGHDGKMSVRKEVEVNDENGEKKMTIKTTTNGQEKIESFEGKDVDAKVKELGDRY